MTKIYCQNCNNKLSENEEICPSCGSRKRHIHVKIKEKIKLHDSVKGKLKQKGIKDPIKEFKVGDSLHENSGKWNYREMDINRKDDRYKEVVKDKNTGEIIHSCDEALSNHKGHGDAKRKKKKF